MSKQTRIIIAGGRDFRDIEKVEEVFFQHFNELWPEEITIVSGGARGADAIGERLARAYNTNLCVYPAQWEKYGKAAGYKRNAMMAANADVLLAFWDHKSKGTRHMIDLAGSAGLRTIITRY